MGADGEVEEIEIVVAPSAVDWSQLHVLLMSSFEYMRDRIDPPSSLLAMSAADLQAKATTETLIVATVQDRLVGCVFCRDEAPWLYIGKMAVATSRQGCGIGRKLIEAARALAIERGFDGMELETRIELTENHATFSRFDFVRIAEQSHAGYSAPTSIRMRAVFA